MRLLALLCLAGLAAAQPVVPHSIDKVAAGFSYADGPVWSKDGHLTFSDVPAARILRFTPGKGVETVREDSGAAAGNALDDRGRLISCETGRRRLVRASAKGAPEVLADKFEGKRLNSPNDVAIRHDGHIYFTDPAFGSQDDARELTFYGIFHLTPRGELQAVLRSDTRPNGIAISPNGRTLYSSGADERVVRAWDLDRQGNASAGRILVSGIEGAPGGLRCDDKGNLWLAAAALLMYSPEGKLLARVPLPETPSSLAFGDADLETLYVTARTSLYRIRFDSKGPSKPQ